MLISIRSETCYLFPPDKIDGVKESYQIGFNDISKANNRALIGNECLLHVNDKKGAKPIHVCQL